MNIKVLILISFLFSGAFSGSSQEVEKRPKLVVGIVVDQMRPEYLYRFYDKFQEGGFKRLMQDGFMAKNTHYNYVPTKTAPGHASIYTGSTPRYHGIISNSWFDRKEKRVVENVEDSSVKIVGNVSNSKGRSPHKLIGTTVTDELQISTNGKAKVISVSLKDRGAILPGGHLSDGSFWFDSSSGNFVTSTYYMEELPKWVKEFNRSRKADSLLNLGWNTLFPIENYIESNGDDHEYELRFPNKKNPVFPYDFSRVEKDKKYDLLTLTPHGNTILRQLAVAALKNEAMGQSNETDFLAISFSSTDAVGHKFGPQSIEVEDIYLRLDREIAIVLKALDEFIGVDNYTLFLTADHGAVDTPGYLAETRVPVTLNNDIPQRLTNELQELYGTSDFIMSFKDQQIFLDEDLIVQRGLNISKVVKVIENYLYELDGTTQVYLKDNLRRLSYSDKIGSMVQLGYHNVRSGDIAVVYNPMSWSGGMDFGTTHGTPYNYDTHVPLIWFGMNIRKGQSVKRYHITDIAPTLSELLHVKLPSNCIGNPIQELFADIKD